ncbi:MAG TPA: hypothetical protein VJ179_03800 [Patescibacteria group bacterium]|nr:hypothetical protein [Patescibacteria group bacterium]
MTNVEVGEPVTRPPEEEVEHGDEVEAVEEGNARPVRTVSTRKATVFDVERNYEGDTHAADMPLEAYQHGYSGMGDPRVVQRHREENPYSR